MKTIRTIIATLSAVLLTFALVAWFSVRRNAAFIQRTIYQGFDQTFVVALVMGCAFLLIAIILTVAIVSTDEDEEDEEDEAPVRPKKRPQGQSAAQRRSGDERRSAAPAGELPYRRVTRTRSMDQSKPAKAGESDGFARPKAKTAEKTDAPRKAKAAERPDEIAIRRQEPPQKKEKKAPAPEVLPSKEEVEDAAAPLTEAPRPEPEAVEPVREETVETPEPAAPAEAPAPGSDAVGQEAPETAATPGKATEPEAAPHREGGTVRCIFCGSVMARDSLVCPNCGKKR